MKHTPAVPLPVMTQNEFAAAANVSGETLDRLLKYDSVLMDWASRHNLVARSTLPDRWRRHYLDSAQLLPLIPERATAVVDLGSGAGFPGLVLAAMGAGRGLGVTLVETTLKKVDFLKAAAAAMDLHTVAVLPQRIETLNLSPPDIITARALAGLPKLLAYAHEIAGEKTLCLFLKGQDVEAELTEAAKSWQMDLTRHPSITSAESTILAVRNLRPRKRARA